MYTLLQFERTLISKEDLKLVMGRHFLRSRTDSEIATYGQCNFYMNVKIHLCIIVMKYREAIYIV